MAKKNAVKAISAAVSATVAPAVTAPLTAAQVAANATAAPVAPRYVARAAFSPQQVLATVAANPKRASAASRIAYDFYKVGSTLEQCAAANAAAGHTGAALLGNANFAWDLAHGFITLKPLGVPPTAAPAPAAAPVAKPPKAKKVKTPA
jgi:hypothetical protein